MEFKVTDKYPGKSILIEAKELFNDVENKKNISQFFNYVFEMEDDFLDLVDELDPVLSFFQGSQKTIFNESCNVYEIYESNKNLINDSSLTDIANEINQIITMPNPYSNIMRLPELNNKFNQRFDEILEDKKTIILNGINGDYESVISRLNDAELKNEFKDEFTSKFDSLKNKLNSAKNIAIINGITTESENLKSKCIEEINIFVNKKKSSIDNGNGESSVQPIEIDVDIKNITLSPKVKMESEDEIDEFINKLKSKLKDELKNADIINLKL